MLRSLTAALAVALASAPLVALADPPSEVPFEDPSWRVVPSLLAGVERFDYHESVTPPLQSKHDGTLATAKVAVEVRSPRDRWYGRLSFGMTDGSMTYVGSDQLGNPITGPTSGYMSDTEGVIGWRGHAARALWIGTYAGVGHRTWRRDLTPIGAGGYLEEYAWSYVPLAVTIDSMPAPRVHVAFDAAVLVPFGGSLRAHFSEIDPTYSDLDLGLVNDLGGRMRLGATVELTREVHLLASLSFEATSILQGPQTPFLVNGQPATDGNGNELYASEPDTHTYRTTFAVGAEYAF